MHLCNMQKLLALPFPALLCRDLARSVLKFVSKQAPDSVDVEPCCRSDSVGDLVERDSLIFQILGHHVN